MSVGATPV